jgi:hypothetical protein
MNNKLVVVIIITISILLYILYVFGVYNEYFTNYLYATYNEYFTNDDYIYINDNIDNILNVDNKNLFSIEHTDLVRTIDYMKKDGKISNIPKINTNKFKFLIDPYISKYILNNTIEVSGVYNQGIFVCLSNIRPGIEKCMWDFNGKIIGYIYMSDYLFIQAIIKAYRQDITKIKLRKIKVGDLKFIEKQFDYLFTYVVIGSEYMNTLKYSRYYINGLKDFDIYRLKLFYPVIEYNYNKIRYYFNKDDDNKNYDIFLSDDLVLIPMMKYDIIQNIQTIEKFITRLELPKDYLQHTKSNIENIENIENTINPLNKDVYACYGNNNITNKFECDSHYTKEGIEKNYYSIWDKKCSSDNECPYYKSNKKYNNNRGGCVNGYCEMPIGVKRIGFTKYSDIEYNKPFCYECSDTTDLECCAQIANKNKLTNNNNDYVFENDTEYRKKYNLNILISVLDYRNI